MKPVCFDFSLSWNSRGSYWARDRAGKLVSSELKAGAEGSLFRCGEMCELFNKKNTTHFSAAKCSQRAHNGQIKKEKEINSTTFSFRSDREKVCVGEICQCAHLSVHSPNSVS